MDLEAGDDYYEYIHLFFEYRKKFDEIIQGNYPDNDISNCQSSTKESFKDHEAYKKECPKIEKYLTYLNNNEDGYNFVRCRFLNYVLNSEKIYNTIDSHSKSDIIAAYKTLSLLKSRCYGNIENIKSNILTQLQVIYNLYDFFYNIKIKVSKEDKINCDNADKCVQLYGEHYEECRKNSKHKFCQQLIQFQKLYNEFMKNITNCNNVLNYLPNIETDFISPITIAAVIILMTLSCSFILLKFTPVGSWLASQRERKKKIKDDINKNNLELSYNSEHAKNNLSKSIYNIQYNTA
ncbi:PIR protein [Plasmodium vivax]|uniref:VIR protein n=1 Tax=Plasmodium vivax TaxID=5855 RepID=A0A565A5W2_PLAVI|nr:PIR protein [Plasmodium vivax]